MTELIDDSTLPGRIHIENFHYIKSITDFFKLYDNKSVKDAKKFLDEYLIYCFMYKRIKHIKSIILNLNLDTTTIRLKCIKRWKNYKKSEIAIKFNMSFVCFAVFCNDIDLVKFLIKRNNDNYRHDDDDDNYFTTPLYLRDFDYITPLFVAVVYTQNREMIDFLIQHYGADINKMDIYKKTPLMKVLVNDTKYYDFLISRGAKVNLKCKVNKTALNYIIQDRKRGEKRFDVALHLIEKYGVDPYALNHKNCNLFMSFAIHLNSDDYIDPDNDYIQISPYYDKKVYYIEKLLKITNPTQDYVQLTYNLFAACIIENPSLKLEYFNKGVKIKEDDDLLLDKEYWIKRFESIVGDDDNDENLYIHSVKMLNRILIIYDKETVIDTIVKHVLPIYENNNRYNNKYINLLIYLLDLVTENRKFLFEEMIDVVTEQRKFVFGEKVMLNVYFCVFRHYIIFVNNLKRKRKMLYYYNKYFKYMLNRFMEFKDVLYIEEYSNNIYDYLVAEIHRFIFRLYERNFHDKRKKVEKIIKYQYPINLLTKTSNECLLHSIFKYNFLNQEEELIIMKQFLYFLLRLTKFKISNLNLKSKPEGETPLSLALKTKRPVDIIKILLDNGSVIATIALASQLNLQYPNLKIYQNYFVSLQSLAAGIVANNNNNVPKHLEKIIEFHTLPKRLRQH